MAQSKGGPWLKEIPKVDEILAEVLNKLGQDFLTSVLSGQTTPSQACQLLEQQCHKRYIEYEEEVKKKYSKGYDPIRLESSLSQSRVTRAGDTVEKIFKYLLTLFEIPCERGVRYPRDNGELLDFVIPNRSQLHSDPTKAVIISVKREVRERWREVVGEAYILREIHKIPDNIWFATITCDVSEYTIRSMVALRMRVYVPDECYSNFKPYGARPLSSMFEDLLSLWKKEKKDRRAQGVYLLK